MLTRYEKEQLVSQAVNVSMEYIEKLVERLDALETRVALLEKAPKGPRKKTEEPEV